MTIYGLPEAICMLYTIIAIVTNLAPPHTQYLL